MSKYEIAPTRTNLINFKNQLSFATQGYELLQQKKDILVAELLNLIDTAKDLQEQIDKSFKQAFQSLRQAILAMGEKTLQEIAAVSNLEHFIAIKFRKTMGVAIPIVNAKVTDMEPFYGLTSSSPSLDETILNFRHILEIMGRFSQTRISVLKISKELQKTIRRVNALEKIYIPDYKESLKYIQDSLEESERETFFMLKTVKNRLEQKKGN